MRWEYMARVRQMSGFRIAITGTPATGKTSVATIVGANHTLTVRNLAEDHACLGDFDEMDGSVEIDIEKLNNSLSPIWANKPPENIVVDGHLSHHLPVDAIVVLRCRPEVLSGRMRSRGWPETKVSQNSEWEMMGGPWLELDEKSVPIIEFDTTIAGITQITQEILNWLESGFSPEYPSKRIDWLE